METGATRSVGVEIIEDIDSWRGEYRRWQAGNNDMSDIRHYPWVTNRHAPFTPARRALSMTNVALISSAGAYIDGTPAFGEGVEFREIPREVDAADLRYEARGYDPAAAQQDRNVLIPVERLLEYRDNGVIGDLNAVWWSFCGYMPDAAAIAEALPALVERVLSYDVRVALLVPASKLCQQS